MAQLYSFLFFVALYAFATCDAHAQLAGQKAIVGRIDAPPLYQQQDSGLLAGFDAQVLTVGVYHFPPYQIVDEDGSFTGFAIESLRNLAARADLKLTFKAIKRDEWHAGPGPGRYDLLPQTGITDDRLLRMDFTKPIDQTSLSLFVSARDDQGLTDIDNLSGLRVAVHTASVSQRLAAQELLAEQYNQSTIVLVDEVEEFIPALLEGRADAVLYWTGRMREIIAEAGLAQEVEEIKPALYQSERAPALRFGLGVVREQLNTVIPGYLASTRYQQLRETWLGEKLFWTTDLLRFFLFGVGLIALALTGALFQQRSIHRTSKTKMVQKHDQQEHAHTLERQALVTALERSNRDLDNFAYIASHDLKEPVRGISINVDFLSREEVSEAGKDRIERMLELTARMDQQISDLFIFSRLGRGDESQEEIEPIALVESIKYELRETLNATQGSVNVETVLPSVFAEKSEVKIIFHNLITNALKYNRADKPLVNIGFKESIEVNGELLKNVFYVQDNGIGIDEKNHQKVLRIFTRLNRVKDFGSGSGAGLSFVSKIIEKYGNELTIASQLGGGSTFFFSLPGLANRPTQTRLNTRTLTNLPTERLVAT